MGLEKLWIVLIVCAALCAVGFYKYVYFLSIGYGLAVAGGAVAIALLFLDGLEPVHILLLALFIAYGVRLSGFLLVRELKNAAYRRTLTEVAGDEKAMPVFLPAWEGAVRSPTGSSSLSLSADSIWLAVPVERSTWAVGRTVFPRRKKSKNSDSPVSPQERPSTTREQWA